MSDFRRSARPAGAQWIEMELNTDRDKENEDVEEAEMGVCRDLIAQFLATRDHAAIARLANLILEKFYDCETIWKIISEMQFIRAVANALLEQNSASADNLFNLVVFLGAFKRESVIDDLIASKIVPGYLLDRMFASTDRTFVEKCLYLLSACISISPSPIESVVHAQDLIDFCSTFFSAESSVDPVSSLTRAVCRRFQSPIDVNSIGQLIHAMVSACTTTDELSTILQTIIVQLQRDPSLLMVLSQKGTWQLIGDYNVGKPLLVLFGDMSALVRVANTILNRQMKEHWSDEVQSKVISEIQREICAIYEITTLQTLLAEFIHVSPEMTADVIDLATNIIRSAPELIQTSSVVAILRDTLECWNECFKLKLAALNFVVTVILHGTPDNARLIREIGFMESIVSAMSWDTDEKILEKVFDACHAYLQKFAFSVELAPERARLVQFGIVDELHQILESEAANHIKARASLLMEEVSE